MGAVAQLDGAHMTHQQIAPNRIHHLTSQPPLDPRASPGPMSEM